MKRRKEKIRNSVLEHSSRGTFSVGDKNHLPRLISGGHGEENISALKNYGWDYNIVAKYPNGVRLGNVPSHKEKRKRSGDWQVWFPRTWTRHTIRKAGEKTANSLPYKLPNGYKMFGTYKKVKVCIIRTNGKSATIFPYYKQSGSKKCLGKTEV